VEPRNYSPKVNAEPAVYQKTAVRARTIHTTRVHPQCPPKTSTSPARAVDWPGAVPPVEWWGLVWLQGAGFWRGVMFFRVVGWSAVCAWLAGCRPVVRLLWIVCACRIGAPAARFRGSVRLTVVAEGSEGGQGVQGGQAAPFGFDGRGPHQRAG
jgi:hypothetical protein